MTLSLDPSSPVAEGVGEVMIVGTLSRPDGPGMEVNLETILTVNLDINNIDAGKV